MRKLQSAMIALFCTGVFAAGLGTGMTCSEFTSFAYMGNADVEPVDMKTDILEYDMSQDTSLNMFRTNHLPESEEDIVADASVPRGTSVSRSPIMLPPSSPMWNFQKENM